MADVEAKSGPKVEVVPFGKLPDGRSVDAIVLKNSNGMVVKLLTYGAIISECWVPDRDGKLANVALGFDNLEQYLAKHPRFGSTIGRYANRIKGAEFELDGVKYKLAANKGTTTIHGGNIGFDKVVWKIEESGKVEKEGYAYAAAKLSYLSVDMEEGFPGNLKVEIEFRLEDSNSLMINYRASTDKATPINLTNHSYFNLRGAGCGNILDHVASFNAGKYTPLNEDFVPTGEFATVEGTPFDFRKQTRIGERIEQAGGYDLNYVINMRPGDIEGVGSVIDPESGRCLTTFTDQPGFQFFTANGLDGSIVGLGGKYEQYAGFCIETQHFPDSLHHPNFPSTILRPGETFGSITQYAFSNLPAGWKPEKS